MTLPDTLYLDGIRYDSVRPAVFTGWRLLHMAEGGDPHEPEAPAVHNSESVASVDFTRDMQLKSYEINVHNPMFDNPLFTGDKWRSVYNNKTAFTNGQGFDKANDPRVDYVNGRDLGAPYPRLMRAIICSGSFFRGQIENTAKGTMLTLYPGVHGIDVMQPIPSVDEIIARHWYFYAVTAGMKKAHNFPQGSEQRVIIPLYLKVKTQYPLSWFTPWVSDEEPDPTRFYL